ELVALEDELIARRGEADGERPLGDRHGLCRGFAVAVVEACETEEPGWALRGRRNRAGRRQGGAEQEGERQGEREPHALPPGGCGWDVTLRIVPVSGARLQSTPRDLDLDRMVAAVALLALGVESQQVAAAQLGADFLVDARQLGGVADEEGPAAGLLGEVVELAADADAGDRDVQA